MVEYPHPHPHRHIRASNIFAICRTGRSEERKEKSRGCGSCRRNEIRMCRCELRATSAVYGSHCCVWQWLLYVVIRYCMWQPCRRCAAPCLRVCLPRNSRQSRSSNAKAVSRLCYKQWTVVASSASESAIPRWDQKMDPIIIIVYSPTPAAFARRLGRTQFPFARYVTIRRRNARDCARTARLRDPPPSPSKMYFGKTHHARLAARAVAISSWWT